MNKIVLLTILLVFPQIVSASGDACGGSFGFQVERATLSICDRDLPFIDVHNDSIGNLRLLESAYIPNSNQAKKTLGYADQYRQQEAEETAAWDKLSSLVKALFTEDLAGINLDILQRPRFSSIDFGDIKAANTPQRASDFIEAASHAISDKSVLKQLVIDRIELLINVAIKCDKPALDNNSGNDYLSYEKAANDLYCLRYKEAGERFCGLENSKDAWIKEASGYLCARAWLLKSQEFWDGYVNSSEAGSTSKNINVGEAKKAKDLLQEYLKNYPTGQYAKSARGLLRRADYFMDDWVSYVSDMDREYGEALKKGDSNLIKDLGNEFDHYAPLAKIHGVLSSQPLLTTPQLLISQRMPIDENTGAFQKWLDVTKGELDGYPGLAVMIKAQIDFAKGNYEKVLEVDIPKGPQVIQMSLQNLRAGSLEALKRWDEAIALRKEILKEYAPELPLLSGSKDKFPVEQYLETYRDIYDPEYNENIPRLQLAILRTFVRAGKFESFLHSKEPQVPEVTIQLIIQKSASEAELEKLCTDSGVAQFVKDTACRTKAYLELYREDFAMFNSHYSRLSDLAKSDFKQVEKISISLAKKESPQAIIDYANFLIEKPTDRSEFKFPDAGEGQERELLTNLVLGEAGKRSGLESKRSAIRIFEKAMLDARSAKDSETEAHATALFINCFRYGNRGSACQQGEDDKKLDDQYPLVARQKLFAHLKSQLGKTKWGRDQKYCY